MIGHCFNSECNEELRYLREGSVYQREIGDGRDFHAEFFWLCQTCSSTFNVVSDDNGSPLLVLRSFKREVDRRHSQIRRVFRGVLPESVVSNLPDPMGVRPSGPSNVAG